jgi:hypothetical protein
VSTRSWRPASEQARCREQHSEREANDTDVVNGQVVHSKIAMRSRSWRPLIQSIQSVSLLRSVRAASACSRRVVVDPDGAGRCRDDACDRGRARCQIGGIFTGGTHFAAAGARNNGRRRCSIAMSRERRQERGARCGRRIRGVNGQRSLDHARRPQIGGRAARAGRESFEQPRDEQRPGQRRHAACDVSRRRLHGAALVPRATGSSTLRM